MQSRYYNPDWGRFINADAEGGKVGELLSHNVFAYCMNNPVNMSDPNGNMPTWLKWTLGIVATVVVVAAAIFFLPEEIVATVVSAGAAAIVKVGQTIQNVVQRAGPAVAQAETRAAPEITAKSGTKVTGFTSHGVDRAIGDGLARVGVRPQAILDALKIL